MADIGIEHNRISIDAVVTRAVKDPRLKTRHLLVLAEIIERTNSNRRTARMRTAELCKAFDRNLRAP